MLSKLIFSRQTGHRGFGVLRHVANCSKKVGPSKQDRWSQVSALTGTFILLAPKLKKITWIDINRIINNLINIDARNNMNYL